MKVLEWSAFDIMEKQDAIYLLVLFASIPLAHLLKILPPGKVKQLYGGVVGLAIAVLVCGWQVFHSLVAASVNYLFIRYFSER